MSGPIQCCGRCAKCMYMRSHKTAKALEPVPPGMCNRCRAPVPKRRRYCDSCRAELRRQTWRVSQTRHRRVLSGFCPYLPQKSAENDLQRNAEVVPRSVGSGASKC